MNVLITGGNSQLAQCIKRLVNDGHVSDNYIFVGHDEVDITTSSVKDALDKYNPEVVVNCAAYTNAEKAEEDSECNAINFGGTANLAINCSERNIKLIHISTDYVFDGEKNTPYTTEDKPNPLNKYGFSKWLGEAIVTERGGIVIRTSWLYSEYGKNFFKTMYEHIRRHELTKVVSDQVGTPTYAHDLAWAIANIIEYRKYEEKSGIYQFSNEGVASWYDFAFAIEVLFKKGKIIAPPTIVSCATDDYPHKATRPKYSVMDKSKFYKDFGESAKRHWIDALIECFNKYKKSGE